MIGDRLCLLHVLRKVLTTYVRGSRRSERVEDMGSNAMKNHSVQDNRRRGPFLESQDLNVNNWKLFTQDIRKLNACSRLSCEGDT